MRPHRRLGTERLPQQLLLRRVRQVLLASDDLRDFLVQVVHDVGDQKDRGPVTTGDHEVLDRTVRERRLPADQVDHDGLPLVRRPEPQRPPLLECQPPVPAEPVVPEVLRPRALLQLLPGAVAVVRPAGREELLSRFPMPVGVVRLEVRPLEGRVLAMDADRRERADDALGPLRLVPGCVGVLDPQDEPAAGLSRHRPVVESGPCTTDMEHAGRGRGETNANRGSRHAPRVPTRDLRPGPLALPPHRRFSADPVLPLARPLPLHVRAPTSADRSPQLQPTSTAATRTHSTLARICDATPDTKPRDAALAFSIADAIAAFVSFRATR